MVVVFYSLEPISTNMMGKDPVSHEKFEIMTWCLKINTMFLKIMRNLQIE